MSQSLFKFKRFEMLHGKGSMKIGVDAVLIGAWAGEGKNILEVGTGCGVISLILAQRFTEAQILAIDIDIPSVEEASENFSNSPWGERLRSELIKFPEGINSNIEKYDLIISNPPYFRSGITAPLTPRLKARHQDSLSVFTLLDNSPSLLIPGGRLCMIFPVEFEDEAIKFASQKSLVPVRICRVRDNRRRSEKRVMTEFKYLENSEINTKFEYLTLFEDGKPTDDYLKLCKDFYLKF